MARYVRSLMQSNYGGLITAIHDTFKDNSFTYEDVTTKYPQFKKKQSMMLKLHQANVISCNRSRNGMIKLWQLTPEAKRIIGNKKV